MTDNEARKRPENKARQYCAATRIAAAIVIGRKILLLDRFVTNFSSGGGVSISCCADLALREGSRAKKILRPTFVASRAIQASPSISPSHLGAGFAGRRLRDRAGLGLRRAMRIDSISPSSPVVARSNRNWRFP
jgi:hypothetical protein